MDVHLLMNNPIGNKIQYLEPLMNDVQLGVENGMPTLKYRVTGLVAKPIDLNDDLNDDAECTEVDLRFSHGMLHEFEG